jgi:Domain of unknown function (DUF2382)
MAAFKEGAVEMRESVEEPVVGKTARVVEEVVVGKESAERTETVKDTVRKGKVKVDKTAGGTAAQPTYDEFDSDFRNHWQQTFGSAGVPYEDYAPAYRYGGVLADDARYRNREWSAIEPEARRDWETRYPDNTWDRFKAAVRHGWERVKGRR